LLVEFCSTASRWRSVAPPDATPDDELMSVASGGATDRQCEFRRHLLDRASADTRGPKEIHTET
jgi:hypothetical protein